MQDTTQDGFLGNRLHVRQFAKGHRSGTDAVLLAAAIEAKAGDMVVELGSGAGVASLCLASRQPQAQIIGYEIDEKLVSLAQANAVDNECPQVAFYPQDIHAPFSQWEMRAPCDWLLANPPFYDADTSTLPPDMGKQAAHIARGDTIAIWMKRAASLVKPNGCAVFIHRVQALPLLLQEMGKVFGGLQILPLAPRKGAPAQKILLRGWRDSRAPIELLCPLHLHKSDDSGYEDALEAILRHGAALDWRHRS